MVGLIFYGHLPESKGEKTRTVHISCQFPNFYRISILIFLNDYIIKYNINQFFELQDLLSFNFFPSDISVAFSFWLITPIDFQVLASR